MHRSRLRSVVVAACILPLLACDDLFGPRGQKISVSLEVQHAFNVQPVLHVNIDREPARVRPWLCAVTWSLPSRSFAALQRLH